MSCAPQPGLNVTKCCLTWSNKPNATNSQCKPGQKKSCTDGHFCANPNPATGEYGAECAPWDPSLWPPALKSVEPLVRLNSPSGIVASNFMGGIHPVSKREALSPVGCCS